MDEPTTATLVIAHRQTRPRAALSDRQISLARAAEGRDLKLFDGNGLFLLVRPNGSKLWRWKYRSQGKEKLMSFGSYPSVSLSQARKLRDAARGKLSADIDPMAARKTDRNERLAAVQNSFRAVARQWWEKWRVGRTEQHAGQVWRRFEADVFPRIGSRPISEIKPNEVVALVKAIEASGRNDLAKRAHQTISSVFRHAVVHELVQVNPAAQFRSADVLSSHRAVNYARLEAKELPDLLRKIQTYQGTPITRLAMTVMCLTFVRTSELICAPWNEIDFKLARWTIPAARMKKNRPHIVPLSRQAIEALRALHLISGEGALLFPGDRDPTKPISNNTILKALERMGFKGRMTGHGFRGIASTVLHENGSFNHDHIELQLAHAPNNAVAAAYNHAGYLAQRALLMQYWADYLDKAILP